MHRDARVERAREGGGRAEETRAELSTAVAVYREMGMTFWLPDAEAELQRAGGSSTT